MPELLLIKGIFVLVLFAISLGVAAYATYGERRIAAFIQDRVGPNRAGPLGLFQPLADGIKMIMKEEMVPNISNKFLFILGPSIAMLTACMTGVVIPFGKEIMIGGRPVALQVADINIGVLYLLGVVSLGVYGIMIGGWASNNKYSLLGALRASSQMISYEIAMGLSIIALVMISGSLSLRDIAAMQGQEASFLGIIPLPAGLNWNIFYQPIGFLIFIVCAFAECNRAPFDLAECETELIGGYHTEYSSMKLGFFLFAEYINMFISSAVMATLYFGGYNMPFVESLGFSAEMNALLGVCFLFAKIFFFIFVFMWVRWTIPRFRFDQLMNLGWKTLIPLALLNILITAVMLMRNELFNIQNWKDLFKGV